MYAFVDQPVSNLCNGGRFLLWAMRGWTRAMERGRCPPHALAGGFAGVGALAMLPNFHMAMALFNRDSLEKIVIAPLEHTRIMEDEAVLISIWRNLANFDFDQARATLALLVEDDSIPLIADAIAAASASLAAAGFDLSELTTKTVKEVK